MAASPDNRPRRSRPAQGRPARGGRAGTPERPRGAWLHDVHVSAFWILMLGILVLAVVILTPTVHLYITQQDQVTAMQSTVHQEESRLDAAHRQLARWNDPSYVRSQARQRLYFVMPGETNYLIIDDTPHKAAGPQEPPAHTTAQTAKADWVGTIFASTVSAGMVGHPDGPQNGGAEGGAAGGGAPQPGGTGSQAR